MIDYLGRTVLLVRDYDEALLFYRQKLGFEVLHDERAANGARYVHIGLPAQPGVGLWLMQAGTAGETKRLGNQTGGGPFLVFYTADCRAACAELERRGVKILEQPAEGPGSVFAHFEDLYGNRFVLVELTA